MWRKDVNIVFFPVFLLSFVIGTAYISYIIYAYFDRIDATACAATVGWPERTGTPETLGLAEKELQTLSEMWEAAEAAEGSESKDAAGAEATDGIISSGIATRPRCNIRMLVWI